MLDNDTKRRIDDARDVLVGKIPTPQGQVEQITIALVYKFMDDMDRESIDMGGKASFFVGAYKKYAWSKMFDPRLGGFEMLALYSDALAQMTRNTAIPQLFRDIFKNAYLPYRDPETLRLFLKTINEFTYDHSERLGDAFEYLLSVLGSQGDAGQFRTPRHIIDFMVRVVDPKIKENILDPACGTAGFLISAYKHILRTNTKRSPGDLLKHNERTRLYSNFKGYDISPDMVRLALVNMYLHGFVQPQIFEYDTLTSEDRWNEYADVILANPPFMSPKGGIIPHKRFSVQSNRSEVLFVDYMAEHLKPTGRAGIIVPEGIIFQSANAYKQLRKYLIEENYFVCVASLPAGVFNPYAGVKTSILFFDRTLAKKTDKILFVKIEADGFDLGAQRRPVEKNDLPDAVKVIREWFKAVNDGKAEKFTTEGKPCGALVVEKKKLAENGEYGLTGERYRTTVQRKKGKWPIVRLGEVCEVNPKKAEVSKLDKKTSVSFVPMEDIDTRQYFIPKKQKTIEEVYKGYTYFRDKDILIAKVTPCFENGKCGIARNLINGLGFGSSELHIVRASAKTLPEFIYHFVSSNKFRQNGKTQMTGTGGLQRVPASYVDSIQIPLPPLSVQQEIVSEIENYQKVIDGARQVVESWKPRIDIDPEWPMVKLGDAEVFQIESGGTPDSKNEKYWNGDIYWATLVDLPQTDHISTISDTARKITKDGLNNSSAKVVPQDSIIVSTRATIGRVGINTVPIATNQGFKNLVIKDKNRAIPQFVAQMVKRLVPKMESLSSGGTFKEISKTSFSTLEIPLPPLSVQQSIVSSIESERTAVDSCKSIIATHEEKIKRVIDRVWEG